MTAQPSLPTCARRTALTLRSLRRLASFFSSGCTVAELFRRPPRPSLSRCHSSLTPTSLLLAGRDAPMGAGSSLTARRSPSPSRAAAGAAAVVGALRRRHVAGVRCWRGRAPRLPRHLLLHSRAGTSRGRRTQGLPAGESGCASQGGQAWRTAALGMAFVLPAAQLAAVGPSCGSVTMRSRGRDARRGVGRPEQQAGRSCAGHA